MQLANGSQLGKDQTIKKVEVSNQKRSLQQGGSGEDKGPGGIMVPTARHAQQMKMIKTLQSRIILMIKEATQAMIRVRENSTLSSHKLMRW